MAGTKHRRPVTELCYIRLVRSLRAASSSRSGSATIEFGMAIAVFLVFVLGIIEFSRALWTDHALDYAAEQATRYVIANPDASTGQVQTYAESQLMSVDASATTVTVVEEVLDGVNYLTVTVVYPFNALIPFVPLGTINLTGVSRIPRST
jgi:Flp pilus assembly protein TadG